MQPKKRLFFPKARRKAYFLLIIGIILLTTAQIYEDAFLPLWKLTFRHLSGAKSVLTLEIARTEKLD